MSGSADISLCASPRSSLSADTLDSLTERLLSVGFCSASRYDWRRTEHATLDDYSQAYLPHLDKEHGQLMSLNVEAVK